MTEGRNFLRNSRPFQFNMTTATFGNSLNVNMLIPSLMNNRLTKGQRSIRPGREKSGNSSNSLNFMRFGTGIKSNHEEKPLFK